MRLFTGTKQLEAPAGKRSNVQNWSEAPAHLALHRNIVAATQQQNPTCQPAQILSLLGSGRLVQQRGTCPLGPAAAIGAPDFRAIPSGSLRVQQGQCHLSVPTAASGAAAALS